MVDPTADVVLSPVETSLYNNVQALLKEMSQSSSQKGVHRWSLQKKLEDDPSCSASLIRVLVRELDKKLKRVSKIHKPQSFTHVIPMLHTLYYAVIQSGVMIPSSLYQTVYECLMKLLILPSPYSAVALHTLRSIKMEMNTPGSLYQKRVTAEQNLNNDHFTWQEKVFVLADPAVFSAPLDAAVRKNLEASNFLRDTTTMEISVVLRVLQAGLGTSCHSSRLAQALEVQKHTVEKYFQEVVSAVEKSMKHGAGGRTIYLNKLTYIYGDILTASKGRTTLDHGSVCSNAMPFPEINFLLWSDEDDLWDLLADFAQCSHSNSASVDEDEKGKRDSGIERDIKESDPDDTLRSLATKPGSVIKRRNAFKSMKPADRLSLMEEKIDVFPGSSAVVKEDRRRHTARVVVMGDDRVLGRLARTYHSIRERESKHLLLTRKLKLQLYYVPFSNVESSLSSPDSPCQNGCRLSLASTLGRVDPWYNSNINSLGATISKLAEMHSDHSEPPEQSFPLLDTLCYYLRCGMQPVNLPLYSVKMTRSSCGVSSVVEDVFVSHLDADIPEFRHLKEKFTKEPSARRKKSTVELFGAVMSVSYSKMSLSKRKVQMGEAPMTCGVMITSEPAALTSGEDHLTVRFDSLNPGYNTTIQTQNISIRTMEHRMLSVCLDKDSRRTYTDVHRIEISPCLDPGCSIRSRFSVSQERELLISKYLDKVLSLPINTFTGVTA
uniref:phosphoinositide 3-kinase regulatory subunit 6 n=1 Tax=Epinephelus lanceolatus TaxID=310571 RepID=UPI001444B872|nr:phosphoinositide 3-kinase regulatory subunit 6 [Epinephelus lanceolatus]